MATTTHRPSWYTDEDDTSWAKIKSAFQRDWTQTKHDFGANEPDLDQRVGDTIAQASGSKPIPPGYAKTAHPENSNAYNDADEPAYRYGYAASRHFDGSWDDTLENKLRGDFDFDDESAWDRRRDAVRRGWTYGKSQNCGSCK